MKTAESFLKSASPYSQSRQYERDVPKLPKENPNDYENRTWRERCHYRKEDGHIYIPPMSFLSCVREAAKYLSIQIPGKGKSTYTKHFEAGVMLLDPLILPETKDGVEGEWLSLSPRGIKGETGVWKCMPVIRQWAGVVSFYIADETITEDIFRQVLTAAGMFIGLGRFRPRKGGYYGRFVVDKVNWG